MPPKNDKVTSQKEVNDLRQQLLDSIDDELAKESELTKSTKKRLERLYVAKQQLIENPKESKELMEKIK